MKISWIQKLLLKSNLKKAEKKIKNITKSKDELRLESNRIKLINMIIEAGEVLEIYINENDEETATKETLEKLDTEELCKIMNEIIIEIKKLI